MKQLAKRSEPDSRDQLSALLDRGEKGDRKALVEAQHLYDQEPILARTIGDLGWQAENAWINAVIGKNEVTREAVRRTVNAMRQELSGPRPTPLERLLVDRVVLCWLQVMHADAIHATYMKDHTFRQAEFGQRRQDRAQRRYLAAIKALALIRRLELPAVQVNIAEKQVNVAGLPPSAAPSKATLPSA